MLKELIKIKSARFYTSFYGKLTIFSLGLFFAFIFLGNVFALTLSCDIVSTGSCNNTIAVLMENETGGYENAHAQIFEDNILFYTPLDISYSTNAKAVKDFSKYENNGTISGVTWRSSGKYNGAYSFDGNDNIKFDDNSILDINVNMTITMWVNSTANTADNEIVLSKSDGVNYGVYIGKGFTDNQWQFGAYNVANSPSGGTVKQNQWQFIVGVLSGTNRSLYVDGEYISSTSSAGNSWNNTNDLYLGAGQGGTTYYFSGLIDDVLIWNRSLTAGEILHINNSRYVYSNALCCSADTVLSLSCNQANVTRISNYTNAHVQIGNYISAYPFPICLSSQQGKVQCEYPSGACSSGYVCLGSIASSEAADLDQTNSHFGSCGTYTTQICCKLNSLPEVQNVKINSTFGTNYTNENLTVYFNQSDSDGDYVTNITDWRINGSSIAVLNLPFDTEETSTSLNIIRDYSTYGNNGTLGNGTASRVPVWTSNGKIGGAYQFDGVNDYIRVNKSILSSSTEATVSFWMYIPNQTSYYKRMLSDQTSGINIYFTSSGSNGIYGTFGNSSSGWIMQSPDLRDNWNHITLTASSSDGLIKSYRNGAFVSSRSGFSYITLDDLYIGGEYTNLYYLNGTIDELLIFNSSLSSTQILELYNHGLNNLSLQKISFNETTKGQNWTCQVTPNDRRDGSSVLSNQLIIRNSLPVVTIVGPEDGNSTTNRTPMFSWTGFDADGDSLTYEIVVNTTYDPGSTSFCTDNRFDTTSNTYYIPSGDLLCLKDNLVYYNWSVRAYDGESYGPWTTVRAINITALTTISLTVDFMEFNNMRILGSNDSTDDSPPPFVIQNDGNSILDINLSATNLWQTFSNPSEYYQFKADNITGEQFAFNWSGSRTTFDNVSLTEKTLLNKLNYSNIKDSAEIDIYVKVPPNEPPAVRNSTVVVYSYLAER